MTSTSKYRIIVPMLGCIALACGAAEGGSSTHEIEITDTPRLEDPGGSNVAPRGHSGSLDRDADGVQDDGDLCPDSCADCAVDRAGCSPDESPARCETVAGAALAVCVAANDFALLRLLGGTAEELSLLAHVDNIDFSGPGVEIGGTALVALGNGSHWVLPDARLSLEVDDSGRLDLSGTVEASFEQLGLLPTGAAKASLSLVHHTDLAEAPDSLSGTALALTLDEGVALRAGSTVLSSPDAALTAYLLPQSAQMWVNAVLEGGPITSSDGAWLGLPIGGELPVLAGDASLLGVSISDMLLSGCTEIPSLGLGLDGITYLVGDGLLSGASGLLQVQAHGNTVVDATVSGRDVTLELGDALVNAWLGDGTGGALLTGTWLEPERLLPSVLAPLSELELSVEVQDQELVNAEATGGLALRLPSLGGLLPLSDEIVLPDALLRFEGDDLVVSGISLDPIAELLGLGGPVDVEARMDSDGRLSSLNLCGLSKVLGILPGLGECLTIDENGSPR